MREIGNPVLGVRLARQMHHDLFHRSPCAARAKSA